MTAASERSSLLMAIALSPVAGRRKHRKRTEPPSSTATPTNATLMSNIFPQGLIQSALIWLCISRQAVYIPERVNTTKAKATVFDRRLP